MEVEIVKTTGRELTEAQARFAFEAQLALRNEYEGPISLYPSQGFTFGMLGNEIVGCLVTYEDRDPMRGTWILTAYVSPDHRRQGVLTAMVDSIKGRKSLNTMPDNHAMRATMAALGWQAFVIEYRTGTISEDQ
jgi:RimJ/RimL family protein N-acetyltransferase